MAISVQEKVHGFANTHRYMADNSAIPQNSNGESIAAVVRLLLQGKNFSNSRSPFPAIDVMATNERGPLKHSDQPAAFRGTLFTGE